ncbi:MAG: MBL fold metallo-hydrolase [Oscillospiraceae bacterium]|jgi:glyoxylase-like metal-dependent hydrolase (beta-lactamase superfamily II)|nr:MBL fold metallo-hydrolase [Oscillospiraceae bacterium]
MLCKYTATPLDAHTFVIEEKTPFSQALCYLLLGADAALLIDTGMPFGNMKKVADGLTRLPVAVANTHAHVDHIGSNFRFDGISYHEGDKPVFALHTSPAYIAELARYALPPVGRPLVPIAKKLLKADPAGKYRYIQDGHVFRLGGREVEAIHTPGHSPGCVCLLDRDARMIFTGDTLCEWGVLLDLAGSCEPETYLASVRRIKALSPAFDRILPGHHGWPVEKGYIEEYETCAAGIRDGSVQIDIEGKRRAAKFGRVLIALPPERGA